MDNLDKLIKLYNDGMISKEEFMFMKLNSQNEYNKIEKKGSLRIIWSGRWFLFDVKTKIFVNNELKFTESTKKGFNVNFELNNSEVIRLKLTIASIKSNDFQLELNNSKNYELLKYDITTGTYSNNYVLNEI